MSKQITRRKFLGAAGVAAFVSAVGSSATAADKPLKIRRIAGSPRMRMKTAKAVQAAIDAAKAVNARIQVELIDLVGLSIAGTRRTRRQTISRRFC